MYIIVITVIVFLLLSILIMSSILLFVGNCVLNFVSCYFTDALSVLFTYPFSPFLIAEWDIIFYS
jgi:hypothetical protein